MKQANQYKQDFTLFLELGFIAVNQADERSAKQLFEAAQALNPESALPKVGMGYLHLHKLELTQAINLFQKVLKEEPENEMAKAFLGLCFSLAPKKEGEGEKILRQTAESKDPLIKNLSGSCLDFIERFVKKPLSPADLQKTAKGK